MKFIINSTATQVIGISETASAVVIAIQSSEQGLSLHIRVDGVFQSDFETGTLEELQAKAATIIEELA